MYGCTSTLACQKMNASAYWYAPVLPCIKHKTLNIYITPENIYIYIYIESSSSSSISACVGYLSSVCRTVLVPTGLVEFYR